MVNEYTKEMNYISDGPLKEAFVITKKDRHALFQNTENFRKFIVAYPYSSLYYFHEFVDDLSYFEYLSDAFKHN